jgi:hypothetical protein
MAPLFSLMVSFDPGATEKVDLDAAVIRSPVLQWICRMIFGGQEEVARFWQLSQVMSLAVCRNFSLYINIYTYLFIVSFISYK